MQRAIGIARKAEQRQSHDRKIEIALQAIRSGRDPQEALRNAK
jgi:hypothetical protein